MTGYPQINLYYDGQFIESYKGRRDFQDLREYVAKHAKRTISHTAASSIAADSPALSSPGTVVSLDRDGFEAALRQGPLFVKFYAPWYEFSQLSSVTCST